MKTSESAPTQNGLEQFSEPDAVARLEKLGVKNIEAAFTVADEKNIDGQPIENAEIFWVRYGVPEEFRDDPKFLSVEGKVYLPKTGGNEGLVLFSPGFPGGNAGRFEQRYVRAFLDAGYAFATVRHNGASLTNGATSAEILNCPKRMEIAAATGEHHIGGTRPEGYGPSGMINEPVVVLSALHGKFNKVHLMGQSMGVAASYNTVTRLGHHPEIMGKLRNVVGISGYIGDTSETPDGIWSGMRQDFNKTAAYEAKYMDKVDLNAPRDGEWFAHEMKLVAAQNERTVVPPHVGNILVFTPADPLIAGPDKSKEQYALEYGPKSKRKLIVEDRSMPPEHEKKAHSMLWIAPENLVRAVRAKVSEHGPHYLKVPLVPREFEPYKREKTTGRSIVQKG